jgi:putative membrane protein
VSALPPNLDFPTADDKSVELSSRRTGMSFQRTRMSADRTLMSVIRTALSLIGFGFTIFQAFTSWSKMPGVTMSAHAPRNFGTVLVALGILMLIGGIVYHSRYMLQLRGERNRLKHAGLIHGESAYPVSLTLLVAIALLLIGVAAMVSMTFGVAPFD